VRIASPELLRLDREALLRDTRDRLLARLPTLESGEIDPTDPGWLLLEQCAWMAEELSLRLDDYPLSVLQQLLSLMGGELLSSLPSIGLVSMEAVDTGVIRSADDGAAPVRLFAPQSETRDQIEFVPLERSVPVRAVRRLRQWSWDGTNVVAFDGDGRSIRPGQGQLAGPFVGEELSISLVGIAGDTISQPLADAVSALQERGIGWLQLEVSPRSTDARARLTIRVDCAAAFAESAPGGLTTGEALVGQWGCLDESTWGPDVRLADHLGLPAVLRGQVSFPGPREHTIAFHHIPAGLPVAELLRVPAAPLPGRLAEEVWNTLTRIDPRLARLRPIYSRSLRSQSLLEHPWLQVAVQRGDWWAITDPGPCELIALELAGTPSSERTRLALMLDRPLDAPVEVWALNANATISRLSRPALAEALLNVPGPNGSMLVQVLRIELDQPAATLLLRCPPGLAGAFLNPMMVINAPVVQDGRSVTIQRMVAEPIALNEADLVGPDERMRMCRKPLGPDIPMMLARFPLAGFSTSTGRGIGDFHGVQLDARSGELRFNAPDASGNVRELRVGTEVDLDWYRRTDGADGNVAAGEIRLVEQAPSARPRIQSVTNPFPTLGGLDGETEEAARGRLFAPGGASLALPADWERELRTRLGGGDWRVRAWCHTERALVTTDTWRAFEPGQSLAQRLDAAGERTLVLAVAMGERPVSDEERSRAEHHARQLCAEARSRSNRITEVLVVPMTPVWLDGEAEAPIWPTHDTTGLTGELVDADGVRRAVPVDVLLLDAVIEGPWQRGRR
jgi:hypothetical protein